jgi:outer membrane murein-binding lipoprotein Lpp
MSKSKVQFTLNSKAARLDAEVTKWRGRQEQAIARLIKATAELKKLGSSVRRLEAKEAKLRIEVAERRAAAKEARSRERRTDETTSVELAGGLTAAPPPRSWGDPVKLAEPLAKTAVAREARMKAMGFRPTKKGKADSKSPTA